LGQKVDVTEQVKVFYEGNPFPGYDELDSPSALKTKAQRGVFARLLDEQLPLQVRILDVGCGTGQLVNFLSIPYRRQVFGTDICRSSLKLGQQFSKAYSLRNASFLQMNLFQSAFEPESFYLVSCSGVLHHTADPKGGFFSLVDLVEKGGYFLVGLYNTWGRIPTDIRRVLFRLFGRSLQFLDPQLRRKDLSKEQKQVWFADQYQHPHESKHTFGEVLDWFDEAGFDFVSSFPKATAFESFSTDEKLFEIHARGTWLDHFLVQAGMLLSGGKEGGFFLFLGQRR